MTRKSHATDWTEPNAAHGERGRSVGSRLVWTEMPDALSAPPDRLTLVTPVRSVIVVDAPAPVEASGATTQDRLAYLDSLRGLLMMLGVFLHAALIYSTAAAWVISDPRRHAAFDTVYRVIHTFRMPAFFIISGFFCAAGLRKGLGNFLGDRTARLVIPFAVTALLVNSVQVGLDAGPRAFWAEYAGGRWVGHLWFLLDLLAFTYLAAAVRLVWPRALSWRPPMLDGAIVLLLPLGSAAIQGFCNHVLNPEVMLGGFLSLNRLLGYLPFFAFGVLYQPGRDARELRRMALWSALLLVLVLILPRPGDRFDELGLFIHAAASWSASLLCLWLGRECLDRPWRTARTLAEASYTVYLLHQLVVVALGMSLMHAALPAGAKYAVVVTGGCLLPLAAHLYLVRPRPWLQFLFNGRRPRPASVKRLSSSPVRGNK